MERGESEPGHQEASDAQERNEERAHTERGPVLQVVPEPLAPPTH